jgi:hypothetical protein
LRFNLLSWRLAMQKLKGEVLILILTMAIPGIAFANHGAAHFRLAENLTVLQAWQQTTGSAQVPQLASQEDGGTVLEWHGGVTADRYTTDASGGSLLTPKESGSYYKLDVEGNLHATSPDGTLSYAILSLTNTDDPSVLSHSTQINTFQIGQTAQKYEIALGDVNPRFSSLGTDLGLRGILGKVFAGQTTIAGSAGLVAENWRSLWDSESRTQYQRAAYAVKVERPVLSSVNLFATAQGYSDQEDSLRAEERSLSPAVASAGTAGFALQKNQVTMEGEIGISRWEEEDQDDQSDTAYVLDVGWRTEQAGLWIGRHDLGPYYASLSGTAAPGVEETYMGGDWMPNSWLTLNGDLRRSENEEVGLTSTSQTVDSFATGANVNLERFLQGLSVALQQYYSAGEYDAGNESTTESYNATFSYFADRWSADISYSHDDVSDSSSPDTDSVSGTWAANIGVSLSPGGADTPSPWEASVDLSTMWQEQELETGTTTKNYTYNVVLSGHRRGWGSVNLGYLRGTSTQPTGGPDLEQKSIYADAAYEFKGQNALRIYFQEDKTYGDPVSAYHEKMIGLQLVVTL